MKSVLRGITINSFALWATSQAISGLVIAGGIDVILLAGFVLTLMNMLVRPVLSLLTLPFNLLTMGLFSWVLNVFIIYLLTVVVSQIYLTSFTFSGFSTPVFSVPKLELSVFQTVILVAFVISFVTGFLKWLFSK